MEIQITKEKENSMFNRKEVKATVVSDASPSREETIKALAEKFPSPPEAIKIKGIHGSFGSKTFNVEANIYKSKEEKDAVEIKKKKEKETEKKAKESEVATPLTTTPQEEDNKSAENAEQGVSESKNENQSEPQGETEPTEKPVEPAPAQEHSEEKIEEQSKEPEKEDK